MMGLGHCIIEGGAQREGKKGGWLAEVDMVRSEVDGME